MVGMSILEKRFVWRRPEADRKRLPNTLSQLERDRVRLGLRYLRIRYGKGELAKRMGLTSEALRKTLKRAPTMRVAVLVYPGRQASDSWRPATHRSASRFHLPGRSSQA